MNLYVYIETISFLTIILHSLLCFTEIRRKTNITKIIYLFNLFLLSILSFFQYLYILNYSSNNLTLVFSLFIFITFFICFILSLSSFQFLRLRVLFIPFFLMLLIFRFLIGLSSENTEDNIKLFDNSFLILHIITSLLSYTLITISLVTSFCTFIQNSYLKKMNYNKIIDNFLPSLYESELLAIRFLYLTILFLIISLISGLYYFIESNQDLIYFFNEKVVLSLISLLLTLLIIFLRKYRGLSGQTVFKMILLSYVLITFSYFGLKLVNL